MLTFLFYIGVIVISYILQKSFGYAYTSITFYSDTMLYFLFTGLFSLIPKKFHGAIYLLSSIVVSFVAFMFYNAYLETGQLLSITFVTQLTSHAFCHIKAYLFFLLIPYTYLLVRNFKVMGWPSFVIAIIALNLLYPNVKDIDLGRMQKQWNREYVVEKYGYGMYHLSDLVFNTSKLIPNYEDVEVPVKEHEDNEYTGILEGTNLIVIHAESMEQFVIGMTINGQEVTPFLNQLVEKSIYFDNFYSQVSLGTSSDSEITFNTGLLPSQEGCTSINYFANIQNALPSLFANEGYTTCSFHANNGNFWNRKFFHQYLGYQTFYSMEDFDIDESIGLGLSDYSFYTQVLDILENIDGNFMTTVISLTNHTPFRGLETTTTLNLEDANGTARYKRYLTTVHYADSALQYFFEQLEQRGLLENTTVVIYGDHGASLGTEEQNQKVPFIIYSPRLTPQKISKLGGMYDALPTLANMYNLTTDYTSGTDLMSDSEGFVLFVDGNYLGSTTEDIDELLKINEYIVRTRK